RACLTFGQRDQLVGPRGPGPGPPPHPREPGRPPPRGGPGFDREPPPDRPHGPGPRPGGFHPAQRAADLLEELVREYPAVPEYRHLLACCYRDLPPDPPGRGQPKGKSNTERAMDLLRELVKDFPRVPDYRFDLCETLARPGPPERFREVSDARRQEWLEEAL